MAPASLVILVMYVVGGMVAAFFFSATIFRFAIKIVARFMPGYGNILLAVFAAGAVTFAASIAMRIAGLADHRTIAGMLFQLVVDYALSIIVYGVTIKDKSGRSLGIFNAILSGLLANLITVLIAALLFAAATGLYGRQKVLDVVDTQFRQAEAAAAKLQAAAAHASPSPTEIPSADQILQQPLPGPAHYYLKDPITVIVAYGQMTYPANTEVHLISQSGDNCEIQIADKTYTVPRSQLLMVQR